jgi:hypothetical protein
MSSRQELSINREGLGALGDSTNAEICDPAYG